ncbi:MAG: efflux RND transporter periplasmic adaptor subunit [Cyanobacteria bacterium P01_E01_bin.34]
MRLVKSEIAAVTIKGELQSLGVREPTTVSRLAFVNEHRNKWWCGLPVMVGLLALSACGGAPQSGGPPPTAVQVADVETATVRNSSIFIASLDAREFTTLQPQVSGRVSEIYVALGDRVSADEPILQINPARQQATFDSRSAAISSAQAALDSAQATVEASRARLDELQADVELAEGRLASNERLAADGAISQDELNQSIRNLRQAEAAIRTQAETIRAQQADVTEAERDLEEARADATEQQIILANFRLTAPFSGVVGNVNVKVGDYVTPETVLTTISQSESLEVSLNVPIERLADLDIGTQIELIDNQGTAIGASEITFIAPDANVATQTILVRATFENTGTLRSEQFVRARVIWNEQPNFVVPVTAVTNLGGQNFVFVAQPNEDSGGYLAIQTPVQLGRLQENSYEVLSGLTGDETIVVTGTQKIFNSAPISPEGDAPPGSPSGEAPNADLPEGETLESDPPST